MPAPPATAVTAVRNGARASAGRRGARAFALLLCAAAALGPRDASAATARVQYVSASNVYLDQGRAAGLTEGAGLTVTRNGKEIARLTVVFVAEHSAGCSVESSVQDVRAGDTAVFSPATPKDTTATPAAYPDSSRAPATGLSVSGAKPSGEMGWGLGSGSGRVHGQITSLYTRTSDPGGTYENPSLLGDVRWSGRALEQTTLRVRATRPVIRAVSDLPGTEIRESKLRIYEVSAGYRTQGGRLDVEAGRILPRRLEGIGYTDGAAIHWRPRPSLGAGLSGGRGANLATAGFAEGGLQIGAYVEAGTRASFAPRRWHALVAGVYSRDTTLTRRQYVMERADYTHGAGASFYQSAEIDLNPRWKRDHGEPAFGWTALSLGGNFPVRRGLSLAVSADSRRAVLLPEHLLAPSTIMLDRFSGVHASLRASLPRACALRVGGDLRRRDRDGEIFSSWDTGLTGSRLGLKELSGGLHVTGFNAEHFSGVNGDASLLVRLGPWSQIDLAGGIGGTNTDLDATPTPSYRSRWVRAGLDYHSPGGLWAALAHEWRDGGPGKELAAELGLNF